MLAGVFGLVFLLVGIAGFVPGLTTKYGQLKFLGTDSNAELLGLFRVSVILNIVHLLFGIGLIAALRGQLVEALPVRRQDRLPPDRCLRLRR